MSQDETRPANQTADQEAVAEAAAQEAAAASPASETREDELSALQKQVNEYLEGWQRERADFANYKKRVERDLKDSYQNASLDVLIKLLPVIDDFDRAMSSIPESFAGHGWLNGVMLIHRKFQKMLDEYGVTPIEPTGQPFDPTRHEAVGMDDTTEVESGHVTVTLQKGYQCGDRVLRPALVRVAS